MLLAERFLDGTDSRKIDRADLEDFKQ